MAPHIKQKRQNGASRGKSGPKRHASRPELKPDVAFSRTLDVEEEQDEDSLSEDEVEEASSSQDSENEEATPAHSYANLLFALQSNESRSQRPSKRRKLDHVGDSSSTPAEERQDDNEERIAGNEPKETHEDDDDAASEELEEDSDDEEYALHDPFELQYAKVVEEELKAAIEYQSEHSTTTKVKLGSGIRKVITSREPKKDKTSIRRLEELKLKKRLVDAGAAVRAALGEDEGDLLHEIFGYKDIVCGLRSQQNANNLRDISALHSLNHIFKTRDRVLKNNAKISQETDGDAEYRDQGFTRPKVLILVPTKQACVRFVQSIVALSEPDQQENRGRFLDTFSQPEDEKFQYKPDDFRELFGGNHEEDFRVGLKFTRKTIKFFSGFYNSDIIFASPLGLMRTITTGGGKKEDKKSYDADFLSSIEIAIMDHANAIEMQNWQHVDYVFSQLNLLPKESHGCDFARARNWYLDGKARYLRQTIIFSDYLTPSITSLASTHLNNTAGRVKYTPTYKGAMLNLPPSLPIIVTQTFLRFQSLSPQTDSDARFKFFTATILPALLRSPKQSRGTLIFTPAYLDFIRLRNYFTTAQEATSLSFGTVSEYSTRGEVARARTHFLHGRHSVLLYSERAHHYFRYKLKGVRKIIFYGVPENAIFWSEMIEALGMNAQHDLEWAQTQVGKQGKGLVRAVFSKWDVMKLERIVGTDRVGRLVSDREGDIFEFA